MEKRSIFTITLIASIIASILSASRIISGCVSYATVEETNSNDNDMKMNISEVNGENSSS